LGIASARTLRSMDYRVMGWSRSPKSVEGVECFSGPEGLKVMLARSDLLVCLLPLTPETRGILNADLFAALPRGAIVINGARGGHLVEADLIPAIDSGQLGGASLDVFAEEPLPPDHPFWRHPKIHVTPHIAGVTHPSRAAETVVEAIRLHEAGLPLKNVVNRTKGY
jgi:glyoxylate/hydroxypyruvate reductase A